MRQRLENFLRIGFGRDIRIELAGSHSSKSNSLPILKAEVDGPASVENFSYNYYFHFLGLLLKAPLPANFMFPISGTFNSYALSGHVTEGISLTNFEQLYHSRANMPDRVGMDVGSDINGAMVIRFILEAYKLNQKSINDVVFDQTRYGRRNHIDANAIDMKDLAQAFGFYGEEKSYDFQLSCAGQATFTEVVIDRFDLEYGGSRVEFELQEGRRLPTLPLPRGSLFVQAADTKLADHVPENLTGRYSEGMLQDFIPVDAVKYQSDYGQARHIDMNSLPYYSNHAYSVLRPGARKFAIHCPNMLDAATVGLFLTKAVGPVVDALMAGGAASD
jgi:hypothetical protein